MDPNQPTHAPRGFNPLWLPPSPQLNPDAAVWTPPQLNPEATWSAPDAIPFPTQQHLQSQHEQEDGQEESEEDSRYAFTFRTPVIEESESLVQEEEKESPECCVCYKPTDTMTDCDHFLCEPCFRRLDSPPICPICRAKLDDDSAICTFFNRKVTGLKKDGSPDLRTKAGRVLAEQMRSPPSADLSSSEEEEQEVEVQLTTRVKLKKDGSPDFRTKEARELRRLAQVRAVAAPVPAPAPAAPAPAPAAAASSDALLEKILAQLERLNSLPVVQPTVQPDDSIQPTPWPGRAVRQSDAFAPRKLSTAELELQQRNIAKASLVTVMQSSALFLRRKSMQQQEE